MALKAVVDNVEELDESLREHYVKDDKSSKFVLAVTDADNLPRVASLKNEAAQHRIKAKEASTALAAFTALGDPTEIQAKLDKLPELEALAEGKLDDGKINQVVETRLRAKLAPIERERDQFKQQVAERDVTIGDFTKKEKTRMIGDAVRGAVIKSQGFISHATDDAIVFAERMLEVTEDGTVVTKDGSGVTPGVDAVVWLQEMQQKKPHWWGPSQGGGANGNRGGAGGGGPNPFSHDGWNMTEQGRMVRENPARAEQMAKSAGTTVGGMRPKAPGK